MRKALVMIALVGTLATLAPATAEGGGRSRRPHFGHSGRPGVVVRLGFPFYPPFYSRPYYYAPYYYSPYVYTPPVYYSSPPVYYSAPPVYYSAPPVYYSAPPVYHSAPQFEREVVFPTGRYVLEGDGVTTAYRWVWMPNPPPVPTAPPDTP